MTRRSSSSRSRNNKQQTRSLFSARGTRAATRNILNYEAFEARAMLSASTELSPVDQQQILEHISSTAETAYLQQNESDLQLIAVENDGARTTSLFQQTVNEIPVHNAYITVVQNAEGEFAGVYDRGFEQFVAVDRH